jgi:uncharacterized protein (TIGR00299 family) protein
MRHIHLQPLGGIAGDMFVASLLDAFPEHRDATIAAIAAVVPVSCRVVPHSDDVLSGSRFEVDAPAAARDHAHHREHHHADWRDIRARLEAAALAPEVRRHAIGIFAALAEAEGRVHGVPPDAVTFHEVGAIDSIADIVAAASLIATLAPARWSVAALPLGGGTVRTAHGVLPVPAPATALLLEGLAMHDDGIAGERVTPTGAAILRHLGCTATPVHGTLRRSGHGFGTRRLPGISNCLRVLVFDADGGHAIGHRELAVVTFEVDDQSGEDLALGLDRLRAMPGVHDVVQAPVFAKKSRLAVQVQVLTRPEALEDVVDACFRETTTIGLRTHLVHGRTLRRRFAVADVGGAQVTVKLVERPGADGPAITAKAEADHLRPMHSHAARAQARRDAETAALKEPIRHDDA